VAISAASPAGARKQPVNIPPGLKIVLVDVALTGAYATGGEALDPKAFGLKRIINVFGSVTEAAGQTTAWSPHWDLANAKLKLFGAAVGATGMTEHAAAAYAAVTVAHLVLVGS
jgi:hypothetical protein